MHFFYHKLFSVFFLLIIFEILITHSYRLIWHEDLLSPTLSPQCTLKYLNFVLFCFVFYRSHFLPMHRAGISTYLCGTIIGQYKFHDKRSQEFMHHTTLRFTEPVLFEIDLYDYYSNVTHTDRVRDLVRVSSSHNSVPLKISWWRNPLFLSLDHYAETKRVSWSITNFFIKPSVSSVRKGATCSRTFV